MFSSIVLVVGILCPFLSGALGKEGDGQNLSAPEIYSACAVNAVPVIWLVDPANPDFVEKDWVRLSVLRNVLIDERFDSSLSLFLNNSVLVFSALNQDWSSHIKHYFQQLCDKHIHFSLIHLSDEAYSLSSPSFYKCAKKIFRNYYHEAYEHLPNLLFLPLGYTNGAFRGNLGNSQTPFLPPSQRKYVWSFIGQITNKPSREAMRSAMLQVEDRQDKFFSHTTQQWGRFDPSSVGPERMAEILETTIFCPSPRGWWNKDSFRLVEALEHGCIPIVEDDHELQGPLCGNPRVCAHNQPLYFQRLFGEPVPFLSLRDWAEAPSLLLPLLSDPARLAALQQQCLTWYHLYITRLGQRVAIALH
eukprot:m.240331 g.240331  ORF g.240331 m.240331 type:complete len:360 (-) comp23304_c0_seq1:26-1105(-)